MENYPIIFFIIGAFGSLVKDIMKDNCLEMPKKDKGKIYLGALGGMTIGGIAGYLIDGNPITAFLAGYAGTTVIENLISSNGKIEVKEKKTIEEIITEIAKKNEVDPDLAIRVAHCESALNPAAINTNKNGTRDRGLYQINDYWHKNVSDSQAFDPVFSTEYFCKRVKEGFLSDWNASKNCWSK